MRHSNIQNGMVVRQLISSFPFFIFMIGVSIVYAFGSKKDDETLHKQIILKALKRSITIYLIYVAIHFLFTFNFHHFRILGVLPRIAIVFFISVIIYVKANFKQWLWIFSIILIVYCLLMTVVPVPGYGYARTRTW
jgi:predicted acyltransferase